jgi:agmatine/peptidylarginine deiminase
MTDAQRTHWPFLRDRRIDAYQDITKRMIDSQDENYEVLQENYGRLLRMKDEGGNGLRVIKLPMPGPVYFEDHRLPASYANFYIANRLVLAPTYRHENDEKACAILRGYSLIVRSSVSIAWI